MSGKRRKLPLPRACFILAVVCCVLSAVCSMASRLMPRRLYDQRAAEYFAASAIVKPAAEPEAEPTATATPSNASGAVIAVGSGELKYAQISAFIARGSGYNYTGYMQFLDRLAKKYASDGMTPETATSRVWLDAASGTAESISVSNGTRSGVVSVTGITGEFFYFHPTKMISGQAIFPFDDSKDVVMLDNQTAWEVFGSADIVGRSVTVGGVPGIVGGVFEKPEGDTARSRVYVSFEMLSAVLPSAELTALEFVLPGPVAGYGMNAIYNDADKSGLLAQIPEESRVIVENSARFRNSALLKTLADFDEFVSQKKAIALPYWENAARGATVTAAVYLLLTIILAVFPGVVILILLVKLYRRRGLFKPWVIGRYGVAKAKAAERKRREKISTEIPETVAPDESIGTDIDLLADFSADLVQPDNGGDGE